MKKLSLTIIAVGLSFALFAQKISSEKVPAAVKETLKKNHPSAMAKWEWEGKDYEANFTEDGREVSCILTKEGVLKETEMKFAELPKAIREYVEKNYHGKKIEQTAKIVTADGATAYEVVAGGKELIFDAAGNFTKEKKEKEE